MIGVYTVLQVKVPSYKSAFYGFNSRTHFLLSTVYSAVLSRKIFDKLVLFTDKETWEYLKEFKGLYDEVRFVTETDIPREVRKTWAIGKIYAYCQMEEPFVHIDNDVYMTSPLAKIHAEQNPIIFQSSEINRIFAKSYQTQFDNLEEYLVSTDINYLPHFRRGWNNLHFSFNAGVMGGSDIELIHNIYKPVFKFLTEFLPPENLSTTLEQAYPAMYMFDKKLPIKFCITECFSGKEQRREMSRKGYTHLLSELKTRDGGNLVVEHCKDYLMINHFNYFKIIYK